jgi:protein-S-isoprenylcysteine O-methyltransferase Ste14
MSGQDHKGQEPVNPRIFPLPPVVLLLFLAGGYGLQRFFPIGGGEPAIESLIAGNALMVLAFAIAVLAARELARAQTAIHPGKAPAALVRTGVFARSRNPIYLSFVFFMVGCGLATANPWMIILAPLFVLYVQERIIKREEGYLTQRFGPDYLAYRKKVRRWF